jgi:hypothetical protein
VLFTGKHSQLVVMCLQPGEEIGNEVHPAVDQFFRDLSGLSRLRRDGTEETRFFGKNLVSQRSVGSVAKTTSLCYTLRQRKTSRHNEVTNSQSFARTCRK